LRGERMSEFNLYNLFLNNYIEAECPKCKITTQIRMKELLVESRFICRGCYTVIKLSHKDASGNRTANQIKDIDNELNDMFKGITFNIKL